MHVQGDIFSSLSDLRVFVGNFPGGARFSRKNASWYSYSQPSLAPAWLFAALVVLCLLGSPFVGNLRAQGRLLRIDLLDKKYDVYQMSDALIINALNNRQVFQRGDTTFSVATAAGIFQGGDPLGFAGIYDRGGRSLIDNKFRGNSVAEDISDAGVVIGWERRYATNALDLAHPERAFIWSTNTLMYLDEMYPEVRALGQRLAGPNRPVGVKGLKINAAGEMIVFSPMVLDDAHPTFYFRVSLLGSVIPVMVGTNQSLDLNNYGDIPPPAPEGAQNLVINDLGQAAGRVFDAPNSSQWSAMLDGELLPDSRGATPTAINNEGYVAASPGIIWSPNGRRVDVRRSLALANTNNAIPNFNINNYSIYSANTFINDAGDIVWGNYMLLPVCPEISIGIKATTGIELFSGNFAVRVGAPFTSTVIIQNLSAVPLRNPTIQLAPPSGLFRQVAGPSPALPAVLASGQQVSVDLEWEALAPGDYIGSLSVEGEADCGPYETHLTRGLLQFIDPPLGIRFDLDPPADPTNQVHLCDDFFVVATVTNLTSLTLTNVAPLSPPTNGVSGVVVALGDATPASVPTIPPGGIVIFKWPMRGGHIGAATLHAYFTGKRNGAVFKVGPTVQTVVQVVQPELIVNTTGDEPDADMTDQCPDVDLVKPGRQTTLRAAIQNANLVEGPDVIRFDLPPDSNRTIVLHSPLPPLTEECELLGTNKSGGWVAIDGYSIPSSAALELRGKIKVSGLAFSTDGFRDGVAIRISEGQNTVTGCRFGQDANGNSAPLGFGILCTAGGQQIGGIGAEAGNIFESENVGVLVQKPVNGPAPTGVIIEGNRFGRIGDPSKHGPANGVLFVNAANSRIGGPSIGARNIFVGSKNAAVALLGADTAENEIQGNWFGLSETGNFGSAESLNGYGIALGVGAHHNRIGGSAAGARNIVSGCTDAGLCFSTGAHDNVVEGNWIGLNAEGVGTLDANSFAGVWIISGYSNRIGGATIGQRNIISGNRTGIRLGREKGRPFADKLQDPGTELCAATRVEGNWIGLDHSGTRAAPNGRSWSSGNGIEILGFATGSLIGGESSGRRNVISGNLGSGIFVEADPGTFAAILGNRIGTSVDGLSALPNTGSGIVVKGAPVVAIGGVAAGQGNQIAYNQGPGINLVQLQAVVPGISLAGNLVYDNDRAASIALSIDRAPNDNGDGDSGPNGRQNWPLPLAAANLSVNTPVIVTSVVVDLSSFARGIPVRLDVFTASGGGGKSLIGTSVVTTGSDPKDRYLISSSLQFAGAQIVVLATTTDGTSEFSPPIPVVSGLDSDGDGLPDALEKQVPVTTNSIGGTRQGLLQGLNAGLPTLGDRNADGIADETQANVVSVQIPDDGPWVTVAASTGRTLTDVVGLRRIDVVALPGSQQVQPGAVRFTFSGGPGTAEPLTLWLPSQSPAPTLWRQNGSAWTAVDGLQVQIVGALWKLSFTLPAATTGSAWILAIGQPMTSLPAPVLTLLPRELQFLGRASGQSPGGITHDAPVVEPPSLGWLQPLSIGRPPESAQWSLQTSSDLTGWESIPIKSFPGATNVLLSFPLTEPARFFRWHSP